MDLKSTLDRCIERGQFMTQEIAKSQFGNDSPAARTITRRWRITEAAELVGVTPQTIRNYEDSGKLPPPDTAMIGRVEQRTGYSIQQINDMRDVFKTRLSKPKAKILLFLPLQLIKVVHTRHRHLFILLNGWRYKGYGFC